MPDDGFRGYSAGSPGPVPVFSGIICQDEIPGDWMLTGRVIKQRCTTHGWVNTMVESIGEPDSYDDPSSDGTKSSSD